MKKSSPRFSLLAVNSQSVFGKAKVRLSRLAQAFGSAVALPSQVFKSVLIAALACRATTAQITPVANTPAQPPSAVAVPARVPSGDDLLMRAASQLEQRASVAARLRHQVSVSGQELFGVGSYWQQGSGEELKVRL